MSLKLKALGLGLIAALAMSAVAVMSASATTGGKFDTGSTHSTVEAEDITEAPTTFTAFGNTVECKDATYTATTAAATVTEVTANAHYTECNVPGVGPAAVHMNGCDYKFTARGSEFETKHSTTHLICPGTGPVITVNSPLSSHDCWIEVTPNQTPTGGVVYTTGMTEGVHDVTLDITAENIHATITTASGNFFACGTTTHTTTTAKLEGKVTVWARDTGGKKVPITVTGA